MKRKITVEVLRQKVGRNGFLLDLGTTLGATWDYEPLSIPKNVEAAEVASAAVEVLRGFGCTASRYRDFFFSLSSPASETGISKSLRARLEYFSEEEIQLIDTALFGDRA